MAGSSVNPEFQVFLIYRRARERPEVLVTYERLH